MKQPCWFPSSERDSHTWLLLVQVDAGTHGRWSHSAGVSNFWSQSSAEPVAALPDPVPIPSGMSRTMEHARRPHDDSDSHHVQGPCSLVRWRRWGNCIQDGLQLRHQGCSYHPRQPDRLYWWQGIVCAWVQVTHCSKLDKSRTSSATPW